MKKQQFICFAKGVEQFNHYNESCGIGEDRAIYYSKSIGKRRLYRSGYPIPTKGLTLLTFDSEEKAIACCKNTNEQFNDTFVAVNL